MSGTDTQRPPAFADQWWQHPFEMFQTNLREVDAGMDVDRVADEVLAFGADSWLVNAGGILSFYPTDLPFQTRNPFLDERASGDLLGDAIAAAHSRGLRVLARMDFSKVSRAIADAHPEWCFVDAAGEQQVYNGLVSVCPSAEYYQTHVFEILDEILDRYEVDGFFFNWLGFNEIDYSGVYRGVSHNPSSIAAFAEFSGGQQLPSGPESENYDLWRQWSAGVIADLTDRINQHIRSKRPDVCLIRSDVTFFEANNEIGRELWHHATSESVSAFRSHRPERPVIVNSVIFVDMPYRLASEEPQHFAHYLVQAISRGANPSTYIMGTPGDVAYPALELAAEVTRFHDRWSAVYSGLRPAASVGIVRPDRLAHSLARHELSVQEFRGFYAALQQTHVPFDVVPLEGIAGMHAADELGRYRVLLLPDVADIDPITASALDAFVVAGGRVVLSGASGFGPAGEARLATSPARALVATLDDEEGLKSTYVSPVGTSDGARFGAALVPVYGSRLTVELNPGSQARLEILEPAPFGPPEKAYGNRPAGQPGYTLLHSGDGIVAQVAWTIGRSYHHIGLTSIRDLLVEIVAELLGDHPSTTATLPEQVEVTVQAAAGTTVVHLLNYSGARRKSFGPEIVVRGGQIIVPCDDRTATAFALVSERDCVSEWRDGSLTIELPEIGLYEVVVIGAAYASEGTE